MSNTLQSTRDVIVRTESWAEATTFYRSVLGLPVIHQSDTLVGFDTGAFTLYVEKGTRHGPIFEFLTDGFEQAKDALKAAGCTIVEEDSAVPRCYLRDPYGMVFNLGRARAAP